MAAPERFAEKSDLLLQRGHRPYMAHFDVCRDAPILPQLEHKRTLRGQRECVANETKSCHSPDGRAFVPVSKAPLQMQSVGVAHLCDQSTDRLDYEASIAIKNLCG